MDISRRDLLLGSAVAITSGSFGFASGMAFESVIDANEDRTPTPGNNSNGNTTGNETDTPPTETDDGTLQVDIVTESRPRFGSSDAPVRMVYWNDYQCPFCARFDSQTLPNLLEEYIDSGDVELILKPLQVFGAGSRRSGMSMHCVNNMDVEPSTSLAWHNRLYQEFESSEGRNSGWATVDNLVSYAGSTESVSEVSKTELRACLEERRYLDMLEVDRPEANELGMQGTPFFLFYNVETEEFATITGAQPIDQFRNTIESLLDSQQ